MLPRTRLKCDPVYNFTLVLVSTEISFVVSASSAWDHAGSCSASDAKMSAQTLPLLPNLPCQSLPAQPCLLHTEKSCRNLIKSNRNQLEFTILQLIWNQTDVGLVPNQKENDKYYLNSVLFNYISKIFLCV